MKRSNAIFFGLNLLLLVLNLGQTSQGNPKEEVSKLGEIEATSITIRDKKGTPRIYVGMVSGNQPTIALNSENQMMTTGIFSSPEGGEMYLLNNKETDTAAIHLSARKDFSKISLRKVDRKDFTKNYGSGVYIGYETDRELSHLSFRNEKEEELASFGINAGKPLLQVLSKEKKRLRYPSDWWPREGE